MSLRFKKVLLVDDDKINNYLTSEIIYSLDITDEVVVLTDGQQTLDHLKDLNKSENTSSEKILILLDLNMPVLDGFEFLEAFENMRLKDDFLIVVLTSSDNQRDKEKIKKYNVEKFLSKPITEEKILAALQ